MVSRVRLVGAFVWVKILFILAIMTLFAVFLITAPLIPILITVVFLFAQAFYDMVIAASGETFTKREIEIRQLREKVKRIREERIQFCSQCGMSIDEDK